MKHVDMRKLPAAAQEERRRQVIGLRQAGLTYDAIAAQVGLTPTGVFNICRRFAGRVRELAAGQAMFEAVVGPMPRARAGAGRAADRGGRAAPAAAGGGAGA